MTSLELVSSCLDRIEELNGRLRAILVTNPDALATAKRLDEERDSRGPRGPLHGMPVIVKDSIVTRDRMPTTAGTRAFESYMSSKDAFLIAKLREAGAVILAKSNLHELSFGFATYSTLGGQTVNPYSPSRQPGGSSGGTAVAVTTHMGVVGIGEDTAGSIRVPSAFNSLVGIRPTVGLVSRTGLVPLSPSRDTAGPMTRTVADAAAVLDAISGYDPADPLTASSVGRIPKTYTSFLKRDGLLGARIGVVRSLFGTQTSGSTAVNAVIDAAIRAMVTLGGTLIDPVQVPHLHEINDREKYVFEGFAEWRPAFEAFLRWARLEAPFKSFEELAASGVYEPVRMMIERALQSAAPAENIEYLRTIGIAQRLAAVGVMQAMADHNLDALVYPAVQELPAKIGEMQGGTVTAGLAARARFPSIVVPAGFTDDGLPVGIEFLARAYEEPRLIELAFSFEQATSFRKDPTLSQGFEADSASANR